MSRFSSAFVVLLLSGLMSSPRIGRTQSLAMSLMGNVQTDASQPIPSAAITVIHQPSGARHTTDSDAKGHFVIANLPVGGPYLIRVDEGSYQPQTLDNIFLESGKTASFTLKMSKLDGALSKERGSRTKETIPQTQAPEAVATSPGPAAASNASPSQWRPAAPTGAGPDATAPQAAISPMAEPTAGGHSPRYGRYPAHRPSPPHPDPVVPGRYDARSGNYLYDTGPLTALKLAGGVVIPAVGVNSTESYLYRFLADSQVRVDSVDLTRGWYNFDKVFFESGKATLTAESLGQLRNVAALLRAFPNARLKLGGYTDNTGDYRTNRQLSEARARMAWASLVEMGISPRRLEARGYGQNYAIAPNETNEGRAQNRRLSFRVLRK